MLKNRDQWPGRPGDPGQNEQESKCDEKGSALELVQISDVFFPDCASDMGEDDGKGHHQGMFDSEEIENDLKFVTDTVRKYYGEE